VATERLYYDDSYTVHFDARVLSIGEHKGRPAAELDRSYFYPESGGQEADRGRLGVADVVDVQVDESDHIWHVLNGPAHFAAGDQLACEVDWTRRFDHMQQHTGQHILSASLERVLGAPTVSSRLGEERSTIDVTIATMDWRAVERAEEAANRVVWEDRVVQRHWTSQADVHQFALRKPPQVAGRIRIVEIPGWDVSACGGTHTRRTGEVGVIKITGWETVRGNVRLEFFCGARAVRDYAWRIEMLTEGAKRHTIKDRELIAHLEKAAADRDVLRKRLGEMVEVAIAAEAKERVGSPARGVAAFAPTRPRDEVRRFALKCLESGAPWIVTGAAAPEPVVIAGRAKSGNADLKALLPELLQRARGKGGGSPDLIQVAAADAAAAGEAFRWLEQEVANRVGG
jgi:alanyl-tRNA synthetase